MLLANVSSHGLTALNRGLNRIDQAAEQIAKASMSKDVETQPADLNKPVVELKEADMDTQAAVKLLKAEHETMGRLLDVTA